jgi:hypothetical protein
VQQIIRSASPASRSSTRGRCTAVLYELCVDVDLAHVADNDGDLEAIAVREDVIEKRRLPCTEKTGEYGRPAAGVWS